MWTHRSKVPCLVNLRKTHYYDKLFSIKKFRLLTCNFSNVCFNDAVMLVAEIETVFQINEPITIHKWYSVFIYKLLDISLVYLHSIQHLLWLVNILRVKLLHEIWSSLASFYLLRLLQGRPWIFFHKINYILCHTMGFYAVRFFLSYVGLYCLEIRKQIVWEFCYIICFHFTRM